MECEFELKRGDNRSLDVSLAKNIVVLKRTDFLDAERISGSGVVDLLGAGVLGDGLGALRDGVLGQLTGEQEPDGGLDLPGGDGGPLVVVGEPGGLGGDALEDVVDERVHDGHGLGGDAGVGVHLLEDLVDVDGVGLLPPPLGLLVLGDVLLGLAGLLGGLSGGLGRHGKSCGGFGGLDETSAG